MNQAKILSTSIVKPVAPGEAVGVSTFKIVSSLQSASIDVYANGNMQVQALIYIEAVDIKGNHVDLTPEQLNSIQLFTYKSHQDLSIEKTYYDTIENEFSHDYLSTSEVELEPFSKDEKINNSSIQQQSYWVRTTKTGGTAIVAAITLGDKTCYTDSPGIGDNFLIINGKTLPTYGINAFKIDITHMKIYAGTCDGELYAGPGDRIYLHPKFEQDDYYIDFDPDKYPNLIIRKVEIWNTQVDDDEFNQYYRCAGSFINNKTGELGIFYFFGDYLDFNPFGLVHYTYVEDSDDYDFNLRCGQAPEPKIIKGRVYGSFLRFENNYSSYSWKWDQGYKKPYFIAYDQYGNPANQMKVLLDTHDPDDDNPSTFSIKLGTS